MPSVGQQRKRLHVVRAGLCRTATATTHPTCPHQTCTPTKPGAGLFTATQPTTQLLARVCSLHCVPLPVRASSASPSPWYSAARTQPTHRGAPASPPTHPRTVLCPLQQAQPLALVLCCQHRGRQQRAGRLLQQRVEPGAGTAHRAVDHHHEIRGGGAAASPWTGGAGQVGDVVG